MKYGKLTYLEIKDKIKEEYTLLIPTGCTEQQGPHLTVDFDTWFAETLVNEASDAAFEKYGVKTLIAPIIPFGPTGEHMKFGTGYVNLPQNLYEEVIYNVIKSFSDQGFKKLVIWRGCGGHYLDKVVERINIEYKDKSNVKILRHPFYDIWCENGCGNIPLGHADSFTTSIVMYKAPQDVRIDKIEKSNSTEPKWDDPNLDFYDYTKNGVIGDPTYATAELGKKMWEKTVEKVVELFKEM